jgi:sterol desaturase/sphingolipid hydroxylase (fatty acid hydroxylase superfamily)
VTSQSYETAAFFGLVAVFETLERLRPAREVDRWKHLKIDALSFALALLMNRISTRSLTGFVTSCVSPHLLGGWSAVESLPMGLRILIAVLLADFAIYWMHRAQHRFYPMWRTHAWHHSIEQLYWFSGFRVSFLHSFLYNIPQTAIPVLVLNLSPAETGICYSLALLIQFWEHTNFDLRIGLLKYVFITPAYHRVHHSVQHNHRNFGATFSFWDRLFGTHCDPAALPANAPLGLGEPLNAGEMVRMVAGV